MAMHPHFSPSGPPRFFSGPQRPGLPGQSHSMALGTMIAMQSDSSNEQVFCLHCFLNRFGVFAECCSKGVCNVGNFTGRFYNVSKFA